MVKLSRATGGKVDLRIIDEGAEVDHSIWFAKIYHLPAANQARVIPNTVANFELIDKERLAA